jgi:hypothetical protein
LLPLSRLELVEFNRNAIESLLVRLVGASHEAGHGTDPAVLQAHLNENVDSFFGPFVLLVEVAGVCDRGSLSPPPPLVGVFAF